MTAAPTTNQRVAAFLQQQTFAERMEMAGWLRDMLNDAKAEMGREDGFEASSIAELLQIWSDAELAEDDQP